MGRSQNFTAAAADGFSDVAPPLLRASVFDKRTSVSMAGGTRTLTSCQTAVALVVLKRNVVVYNAAKDAKDQLFLYSPRLRPATKVWACVISIDAKAIKLLACGTSLLTIHILAMV